MGLYCKWDGSVGTDIQDDSKGYLMDGALGISGGLENYISHGFYPLTITEPVLDSGYTYDQAVWSFANNAVSLTYTVRAKTTEELNLETASALSQEMYYVLKWLKSVNVISLTNINAAPTWLKDAYLARQTLEG